MKIAIIGYGKMGHAIQQVAEKRGHTILCTIDTPQQLQSQRDILQTADVAVEFSTPDTAVQNIISCLELHVPVVCGTTGWYSCYQDVSDRCLSLGGALITASNFSIGMNIMFALNERLAKLMQGREEYKVSISETHHIHKLDAPSGTALVLQKAIKEILPNQEASIESIREGEVPGTHVVCYQSDADTITISHEAHNRDGLAFGAVLAAEWIVGKTGVFTMTDLLFDTKEA